LGRVREAALGAYAHQEVPFEKLVEELGPERDLARTPFFQVMFALQNVPQQNVEAFRLSVSPFKIDVRTSKFDLTLTALEDEQGILGVCEYNTDLFDDSMIERMLRHFETLVASILATPDEQVSRLRMLTESERLSLIARREEAPCPELKRGSLHELFEAQVERAPEAPALICEGRQLTYGELNRRANKLAHYLRSRGIGPDTLAGMFVERSVEMVVGVLGILKAGGAYLPLDPTYPRDRLAFVVADADIKILLTERRLLNSLPDHRAEVFCLDADWDKVDAEPDVNPRLGIARENLAYVIYTSGSTGKPKGVLVSHANVLRLFSSTRRWFDFGPDDVWTLFHSYAFDFSVWELWGALLYGGRLVIVPYVVSRSPESFYELLSARKVTVLNQTPSAFRQLMQVDEGSSPRRDLALRLVIFGGEALDIAALRPWFERHGDEKPQLVNMYGITETTVHVTYRALKREDSIKTAASLIGVPIPDLRVHILDKHLEPVPVDVAGEIFVAGAGVARGYLNRPALTAERFIPDPFSGAPGARLYKTGDSARRLSDGDIEYLGRIDQQVKIRGFRIELGEIEATLLDHPLVRDAIVVAKDSRAGEKQLIAYALPASGQAPAAAELRSFLKNRLPDYMLPAHVMFIDAIPLTSNGKIDRNALPDPEAARPDLGASFVGARTPLEKTLADIWAETVQVESVGIDDNFFELGGDSIRSVQMISKAQKHGLSLTFRELFEHQTIRELARILEAKEGAAEGPAGAPVELICEADKQKLPADVEDAYPLTMLQAGMLFHSSLDPVAAVYHNIGSYHLRAPFDAGAMRAAIARLLSRHPVLRTSFDLVNFSEPMQLVRREVPVPLEVDDLRGLPAARQEDAIRAWIESEKRRQFDYAVAPLLRFHVHRRGGDTFQFGLTEHHAILDGWSVASTLTELFQTYFALLRDEPDPAQTPRASSFRDFVISERQALASEECRTYWADKLSGGTITTLSQLSSTRTTDEGPAARAVDVAISHEISERLKRAAAASQVPLKSVLLAAHLRIISLLSGRHDVMTGVVTHGRPEGGDGERVLGLFLNTLPFRQELRGGTWAELAGQTFSTERELMPFRYYPMAQIQRDLGGQPLFETVFNYTHFHVFQNLARIADLDVLDSTLFAQTNLAFWANFSLDTSSSKVILALSADASLFSEKLLETIGGYYARALESIALDPSQEYGDCDLLSARERSQVLFEWNATGTDYPRDECINQLFEAQVARTPNAVAVACGPDRLTYGELNRRANQLAHHLRLSGVGVETRVGICMERSVGLLVGLMGILKAGGAYVPLDIAYPKERFDFMLSDAQVTTLVTQRSMKDKLYAADRKLVLLDGDAEEITRQEYGNLALNISSQNLAYVIYTSGSTGVPKGVAIEHRSATAFLHWAGTVFAPEDMAGMLASTSICFDLSVFELFLPLSSGGKVILAKNALDLPELQSSGVTLINTVPSAMAELTRLKAIPESVRTVNLAGEPLRNRLAQEVYRHNNIERLFNLYGPSEDTTYSTFALVRRGAGDEPTIGRPISNTQAYVLDGRLNPCPIGVAGELHIGGEGLARCYLNRPSLTAERFIPNPYAPLPGARLYKTGDLARFLPDGEIEFLGRLDHQVKIRGFRIELGEIEAVLSGHAAVREAVVLVSSSPDDNRVVAYVVADAGASLAADHLRAYAREKLPDYMVPSSFVFLDAMPLTPNGKIDRRALCRIEAAADESERIIVEPRDLLELQLVQIWEGLLGRRPISVTDNFFDLGGHSLLAVRLVAQVKERLGQQIPLSALVQGASIESLAGLLRQETGLKQSSPLVAIQPRGPKTPFFCIHPIGGNVLCYMDLARSLGADRPFYGLQAAGLNGERDAFASIEGMAASYVEAMRAAQPEGPYLLGGWSFGGVVAFEMARQLNRHDAQPAHLVLLDSWAPAGRSRAEDRPRTSDLVVRFLIDIAGISGKELSVDHDVLRRLDKQEQLKCILDQAMALNVLPAGTDAGQVALLFEVFERNARAFQDYSPPSVAPEGRAILFRAAGGKDEALDGPALGWDQFFLDRLEVRDVPGDHYTLLKSPHVPALAEQLKAFLDSVS
jgi:amino acid adenylation domain-containing protein